MNKYAKRRLFSIIAILLILSAFTIYNSNFWKPKPEISNQNSVSQNAKTSLEDLNSLEVKGRAPKTGYSRDQFGKGWAKDAHGCSTRNRILKRDLKNTTENSKCQILTGELDDPYTNKKIELSRAQKASAVQIDHVVALSDAWQKGAQLLSPEKRKEIANDPLNLLAVDGPANQQKGDGDAATWLPENKSFRCEYIERQVSVKKKYTLWVTEAEKNAMKSILESC